MAKYIPPEQPKALQLFDVVFLVAAIFIALWLPLAMGWVATGKTIAVIEAPTWELLKQTPAMVEQWVKLGYADAAAAHDVIQNKYNYVAGIDWLQLVIMIVVVLGYFMFLFKASETEYREVIEERFPQKGKK